MGIEPTLSAWEAEVLPLNYTRFGSDSTLRLGIWKISAAGVYRDGLRTAPGGRVEPLARVASCARQPSSSNGTTAAIVGPKVDGRHTIPLLSLPRASEKRSVGRYQQRTTRRERRACGVRVLAIRTD